MASCPASESGAGECGSGSRTSMSSSSRRPRLTRWFVRVVSAPLEEQVADLAARVEQLERKD